MGYSCMFTAYLYHNLQLTPSFHLQACFLHALEQAASKENKNGIAAKAKVHITVFFGHPEKEEGFGLAINITVEGVDDDKLILLAHEVCQPVISEHAQILDTSTVDVPIQSSPSRWCADQNFENINQCTAWPLDFSLAL